jgi:elongation factor 1-gamma
LDAWKRFYSNNETPQSVEYFWQNYDPQGFSLWKVDYKYNDELGAVFMSSNLIGGFFQRLDRARKYGAFCWGIRCEKKSYFSIRFHDCGW